MLTMGSPYFVWINANEIISSWYLLGAVCVTPPPLPQEHGHASVVELLLSNGADVEVRKAPCRPRSWANFSLL
jgi:hypothetical protein